MIIFAVTFITLLFLCVMFFVVSVFIEKNFPEGHPLKTWWRKHVVAPYPKKYDDGE